MAKNDKPLILVADDEPSTLALVANHLRGRGYRVTEASDGDEAWQKATDELPDLVVLDVMMPGMSGWEVCRKIRDAVSLAHTGVIMLTGIGDTLNELTSPLYGADAYLDKPFQFTRLTSLVQDTLKGRRGGNLGRPEHTAGPSTQLFKTSLSDIGELSGGSEVTPARAPRAEKVKASKTAATKPAKAGSSKKSESAPSVAKTAPKPPVKATAKSATKAAPAKAAKSPVKKPAAPAKAPVKKPAAATKKPPVKAATKNPPVKKPVALVKKPPAKKPAAPVKKAPTKKPAAPAKKTPLKKAPATKKPVVPAKKAPVKKAPTKKPGAPTKKAPAKKPVAPVKKAPAKKTPAKKKG